MTFNSFKSSVRPIKLPSTAISNRGEIHHDSFRDGDAGTTFWESIEYSELKVNQQARKHFSV